MNVKEMLQDAIRYEEPFMSHYIYCLLQDGKVKLEDDVSRIFQVEINDKKFRQAYENDILGINKAKIFSLKLNKNQFAFVFAKTKQDAMMFFRSRFNRNPINCYEYDLDFGLLRGKEYVTFRSLRKEHDKFPALAFIYERNHAYGI